MRNEMNQDDASRAQWVAALEASGLGQEEFARQHGIPARTLRAWRKKLRAARQPPADQVLEVLDRAIEALMAIRSSLDATESQAAANGEADAAGQACRAERRNRDPSLPQPVQPPLPVAAVNETQAASRPTSSAERQPVAASGLSTSAPHATAGPNPGEESRLETSAKRRRRPGSFFDDLETIEPDAVEDPAVSDDKRLEGEVQAATEPPAPRPPAPAGEVAAEPHRPRPLPMPAPGWFSCG
jgi:transposase-like protein